VPKLHKKKNQLTTITDNRPVVKTQQIFLSFQMAACFGLKNLTRA